MDSVMAGAMGEIVLNYILAIGSLIAVVVWLAVGAHSGNKFRDNSQKIKVGMTKEEVVEIMGPPSYTKTQENGSYEYIYEKSDWKGIARGGTKLRRMECVFSSKNILISVGKNANCDMSGW